MLFSVFSRGYDALASEVLMRKFTDDDDGEARVAKRRFLEFDCPICQANNPTEAFGEGDDILCHYCGTHFLVKVSSEGKLSLREI